MVICLEWGSDLHMAQLVPLPLTVSCFSEIQSGFTFLVLAHLGSPRKRAVKRVLNGSTQVLLALYAVNCIYNSICVCLQLKSHWTIRVGLSCMSHKTLVSISVQQNLQRNVSCLKNWSTHGLVTTKAYMPYDGSQILLTYSFHVVWTAKSRFVLA